MKYLLMILMLSSFVFADDLDEQFRSLPIQSEGRVKPLGTVADFTLLKFNGKRSFTDSAGERMSSIQWLKQVIFFPEKSDDFEHFLTDYANALNSVGMPSNQIKKKRMRFSYNQLKDFIPNINDKAKEIIDIDAKERSINENALLHFALNIKLYEDLRSALKFAEIGTRMPTEISGALTEKTSTDFIKNLGAVRAHLSANRENADFEKIKSFFEEVRALKSKVFIIPPTDNENTIWFSPDDIFINRLLDFDDKLKYTNEYELMSLWEVAYRQRESANFSDSLNKVIEKSIEYTRDRQEYGKIEQEVSFYKFDYFSKSLYLFLLSFIVVSISWLKANTKLGLNICRTSFAINCAATVILITGITVRCIIRERPPVSTLYESILFIAGVAALVAVIVAVVKKSSLMLAVSSIAGCLGMLLASKYEMKEAVDTMPQLQAVLDTNFWLATHVTCVTMGYAAGLLAGLVSHFYLFLKFLDIRGWREMPAKEAKDITKYVYGIICFGLIFAFIGTLLGGIWANYSWGRFWGWDPKENGAMLIVVWFIIILHARMGGYIRQYGLHVLSVLAVIIICFSWWGVNLLGVGLHSYGFTSGVWKVLLTVYIIEAVVAAIGIIIARVDKKRSLAQV